MKKHLVVVKVRGEIMPAEYHEYAENAFMKVLKAWEQNPSADETEERNILISSVEDYRDIIAKMKRVNKLCFNPLPGKKARQFMLSPEVYNLINAHPKGLETFQGLDIGKDAFVTTLRRVNNNVSLEHISR